MHDHVTYTRSPILATETVPVLVFADVDGTGRRQPMEIEREVAWFPECEAKVAFFHGGQHLKDGVCLVDHSYGLGSCLTSAVRDARRFADHYSVGRDSSLTVEVVGTMKLTAVLPNPVETISQARGYREVPNEWYLNSKGTLEELRKLWAGEDATPPATVRGMKDSATVRETIWTSRNTEGENASLLAAFRAKAGITA